MEQIVFKTKKGNVATDSLKVAAKFGKRHAHVLRDIRTIISHLTDSEGQPKIGPASIFVPWHYTDGQGKQREMFLMNRAAFTLLVMGFTGKKAAAFKQDYIEQFDRMETELVQLRGNLPNLNPMEHTHREVQVANSKSINNHQYLLGGMTTVISYNRKNCLLHTGKKPSEIKKQAKANGMPSKLRSSAKEVLRHTEPAKACAMSFADQLVRMGVTLDAAAEITTQSEAVFAGLLSLGFTTTQLIVK